MKPLTPNPSPTQAGRGENALSAMFAPTVDAAGWRFGRGFGAQRERVGVKDMAAQAPCIGSKRSGADMVDPPTLALRHPVRQTRSRPNLAYNGGVESARGDTMNTAAVQLEEAVPTDEPWGKNLVRMLDEAGPIELVHPEIEDATEWVKQIRRDQDAQRGLNWDEAK